MTLEGRKTPFFHSILFRVALACAVIFGLGLAVKPSIERIFLERIAEDGNSTLNIAVKGLDSTLDRFEPLAKLIAERPILTQLLRDPGNQGILPFVNEQLRLTALTLGVSDVYLMDIGGTTIAASNYRKDTSFVGQNYSYRPYFQQALEGGLGRYFARGTTTGQRGYFFAAPVLDGTRIVGVLAVKFLVDPFELSWQGGTSEIIVSDLNGVIFMSSRPDWHFRTLLPLPREATDKVAATQQYPLDRLIPLEVETPASDASQTLMSVEGHDYVLNSAFLPEVGWTVQLLSPAGPARTQTLTVLLAMGLFALLLALAAAILLQRQTRARERDEERRLAQEELEREVRLRTSDLNAANKRLTLEIEERRSTEKRLRNTQKELVQAGKLAALGQMSAALSHEINQPLAAVKGFAENAAAYIDRKRFSEARENVTRISHMADRMATLSGHLRNFARRPQETIGSVDLSLVLDDALELMGPRLTKAGAVVERSADTTEPLWVTGGRVRLQQVFVNLISNALDAMEHEDTPKIVITRTSQGSGRVCIRVSDRGPGLETDTAGRVFDPFFTTKSPGKGLGLGLSISYNIVEDFGGHLSAENNPDGPGACFSVDLALANPADGHKDVAAE
ncbi:sensor histidine kinase [Silicimonas sp. MF1-12-2]|uniref:sensor histidine kinase n=1 Tax=Silicimonas sp. MF1-12-2 TaxID=3384793 RepID=UPI0039B60A67